MVTAIIEREAADAKERAARIEEATAWRILDPSRSEIFKTEIAEGAGRAITLGFAVGDPESISFAIQLSDLLLGEKWHVMPVGHWYEGSLVSGLRVLGSDLHGSEIIKHALTAVGLTYSTEAVPIPPMYHGGTPDETRLFLYVGTKSAPRFLAR
jgi:hypothetical protein